MQQPPRVIVVEKRAADGPVYKTFKILLLAALLATLLFGIYKAYELLKGKINLIDAAASVVNHIVGVRSEVNHLQDGQYLTRTRT